MARRPLCLIVNPSAGARPRGARCCPPSRRRCARAGCAFRVERTHSLAHARELARGALAAGEVAAAMGGDGLLGAVAGELRGTDGVLGVLPGGRGNDFARKLGIGARPGAGLRRARRRARAGGRRRRRRRARRTSGSPRRASTPTCRTSRTPTRVPLGERRLRLRDAARAARLAPRALAASWSTARRTSFTGYSVAVANSGVFGGGMYLVPGRVARRRPARRRAHPRRARSGATCASLPEGLQGHARRRARTSRSCARKEVAFHADRPFAAYADGDPIADLPVTIRVVPARAEGARPVTPARAQGGRRQGGRHARARRRARRRHVAARQGAHAAGAARDRPARRAAAARQRGDQRDERQDDDGRDGRRDPRAHGRDARPQPRGREHGRRRRLRAGGRRRAAAGARSTATSGCSRSTSSGSAPVVERAASRARCCSATCSATSSTATASSRSSPSAGPRSSPRTPARPRSCSTPTTRSSPTSAATAARVYFGVEDDALAYRRAAARRRLQALPPLRAPLRLRGDLPRPPRPLRAARTAARAAPSPTVVARDVELRGIRSAAFTLVTPEGERARRAAAARPLQRLQRARRRGAVPARSARRSTRSSPGLEAVAPAFGRAETVDLGGRPTSILLVKNPAGANEVLRTLALEGERARPVRRAQRQHRRRARHLVGVGRRLGAARPARCGA